MKKEIILLAISPKNKNWCVVGIDLASNSFVRLLTKSGGDLSANHLRYADEILAQVLDVVEVDFLEHCPSFCHQEDWKTNTDIPWKFLCRFSPMDLIALSSDDPFVFKNSSFYISTIDAKSLSKSVLLVQIEDVQNYTRVTMEGKSKQKLSFKYKGHLYADFSVTDPQFLLPSKTVVCAKALAVITLPNPIDEWSQKNGKCYKFIARLFPL